jgi:hypothetical protein
MRNIFEMDKLRDIKSAVRLNKCGKTFKNNALQACQDKNITTSRLYLQKGFYYSCGSFFHLRNVLSERNCLLLAPLKKDVN